MQWSPQQEAALKEVSNWLRNRDKNNMVFKLFGCAGTGKTTMARHLAEGIDGKVMYAAYTGKAASVMRKKGCANAQTIHSLIYHPKSKSEARKIELEVELKEALAAGDHSLVRDLQLELKQELVNLRRPSFILNLDSDLLEAALLIVDECSMVEEPMGIDLCSFGVPILVLGDPAQLPPVGGEGYFTKGDPDIMLTEIHRQALDNPIVSLATKVRMGERLNIGAYGESVVRSGMDAESALAADQVLVWKNETRLLFNNRIRHLKGFSGQWPQAGEKLVCLRNNHKYNILNGTIHIETEDAKDAAEYVNLRIASEDGGDAQIVPCHKLPFTQAKYKEMMQPREFMKAQEFTYGYALTVHKAQGSQWENVLVYDEYDRPDPAFRRKWLYTAITRASDRVTIAVKER